MAKSDPVAAGDGVVSLMESIWPAFQGIDTSSGILGGAVFRTVKHLLSASRQIGSVAWASGELGKLAERQCAAGREPFQHAIQAVLSRWHPGEPSV